MQLSDPHVTQPNVEMDSWQHVRHFLSNSENDRKMKYSTRQDTSEPLLLDKDNLENPPTVSESSTTAAADETAGQRTFEMSEESELVKLLELVERQDRSFHVYRPGRIDISQLGTSSFAVKNIFTWKKRVYLKTLKHK